MKMEQIEYFIKNKLNITFEYNNENEKYKTIKWENLHKLDTGKQILFLKLIIPWILKYKSEDEYKNSLKEWLLIKLSPSTEDQYSYIKNIKIVENILFNHEFTFEEDLKKIICIIYEILNKF